MKSLKRLLRLSLLPILFLSFTGTANGQDQNTKKKKIFAYYTDSVFQELLGLSVEQKLEIAKIKTEVYLPKFRAIKANNLDPEIRKIKRKELSAETRTLYRAVLTAEQIGKINAATAEIKRRNKVNGY